MEGGWQEDGVVIGVDTTLHAPAPLSIIVQIQNIKCVHDAKSIEQIT